MKKYLPRIVSLLFGLALLTACGDKNDNHEYFPPRADNRVYFVYMAASANNIRPYSEVNITDMKATATKKNIGDGRIYVFYDQGNGTNTKMLEIKAGPDGNGMVTELEDYGEDLDTGDPQTFIFALERMQYYAEQYDQVVGSYILDMWSHGDAWELHNRTTNADMGGISLMSVAADGNSYLELEEFANAIEEFSNGSDVHFDAVVFAQCYGASIEMLYLLRNSTDMVIGSAPEMPMYGIPYNKVLPAIFAPTFDYKGFVDGYCSFYDNYPLADEYQQGIWWRNSGTMAAFDCNAFTDEFVSTMRSIYASEEYRQALADFSAASLASGGGEIGVQTYSWTTPYKYFDVGDFVNQIEGLSPDISAAFWEQMNDIVLYKRTGGKIFYDYIVIDRNKFTGMSTYIMLDTDRYITKNYQYKNTAWYKAVYL